MYKLLFVLLFFSPVLGVQAQYPGYTLLTDSKKFEVQLSSAAQRTGTIKSDFVQEKNLSMLSEKIISKGKFWFKKESLVRMEYTQPFHYQMVINKNSLFIKDGLKQNTLSTKSNKIFQQINRITVDCIQGTVMSNPDFKTRVFEGKSSYLIELSPVTKGIKDLFATIKVVVDKKDYSVGSIEMLELSGDNTIIRFVNKELNVNIPDALFAVK